MKCKSTIVLRDPYVEWFSSGNRERGGPCLYMRGYATIDGRYLEGQDLVDCVQEKCSEGNTGPDVEVLKQLIPSIDGSWALAVQWPNGRVLAATDRIRSIPLFYAMTSEAFVLGAAIEDVQERLHLYEVDTNAALEFLMVNYVTGDATLFKGVCQIQSGELVEFNPDDTDMQFCRTRYYRFFPREYSHAPETELEEEFESILEGIFSRFVEGNGGRKVIVPLGGGWDSRLIVAMLRKQGMDDVLCFSYGPPGDEESLISKEVTEALGYEWRFIEYDQDMWARWMASREMRDYWQYGCKGTSLPHLQDFPAVMSIMEDLSCSGGPIFFPGHSTGMPAGCHISEDYTDWQRRGATFPVAREILRYHYKWYIESWSGHGQALSFLLNKINRLSACPYGECGPNPVARFEMWDAEGRQALYIVNSVRVYEFAGVRWRIQWDYPLMDFFLKVPLEYRFKKRLYINTLQNRIFTGPAEKLAHIEVISDTPPRPAPKLPPLRTAAKTAVKRSLAFLGLLNIVRNLYLERESHPLLFESWFAGGLDPGNLTVAQALRKFGVLDNLPSDIFWAVKPLLTRRLDAVEPLHVLSLVVLGELCARGDFNG